MSGTARRSGVAPFLLTSVGGLVLAGGGSAEWVREEQVRDVAGVPLPEVSTTAGTELAPEVLAVGVGALLLGLLMLLVRGVARRWLGLGVLATGVAAAVLVAVRSLEAAGLPGSLSAGPAVAALGAAMIIGGGFTAWRRPAARPGLPSRYSIDEPGEDDESAEDWRIASVEPEDR